MKLATCLLAVVAAVACATLASAAGTNYAVLVAGSNSYFNYRHQADVCHAFQVLTDPKKGNIPKENIIVFMYDDIANDPENPTKGKIINHPNGSDVYAGVNKDYTGAAVTPENFLAVLAHNKSGVTGGSGRVLESGPDDNVFIYFSDHGATGLVAFPETYLYATDLIKTLKYMNAQKYYNQMVIYIEACESGSMFDNLLPTNLNIFATTASTPEQSSYACYYDNTYNTYLGDEYSVRWLEDSDAHDVTKSSWTLLEQFKLVVNQTLQSQPQQYGNTKLSSEYIDEFQGYDDFPRNDAKSKKHHKKSLAVEFTPCNDPSDSRDVKLKTLMNRRDQASADLRGVYDDLVQEELSSRAQWDLIFTDAAAKLIGGRQVDAMKRSRVAPRNFDCLKGAVNAVEDRCAKLDDYSLKWVYSLVNLCEAGVTVDQIDAAFDEVCSRF